MKRKQQQIVDGERKIKSLTKVYRKLKDDCNKFLRVKKKSSLKRSSTRKSLFQKILSRINEKKKIREVQAKNNLHSIFYDPFDSKTDSGDEEGDPIKIKRINIDRFYNEKAHRRLRTKVDKIKGKSLIGREDLKFVEWRIKFRKQEKELNAHRFSKRKQTIEPSNPQAKNLKDDCYTMNNFKSILSEVNSPPRNINFLAK